MVEARFLKLPYLAWTSIIRGRNKSLYPPNFLVPPSVLCSILSFIPETDCVLISYQKRSDLPNISHKFPGTGAAMDAADNAHHHHMHGMAPPMDSSTAWPEMTHGTMMLHMTFFWGANAEILFNRWPGERGGMYALALIFVFVLAFIVEWLSHSRLIKEDRAPRRQD